MDYYSTLGCDDIAGTYYDEEKKMKIDFDNGQLKGQWLNVARPPYTGHVGADCMGEMNFPDDRSHKLVFDKILRKIYWDGTASGKVWTKGK